MSQALGANMQFGFCSKSWLFRTVLAHWYSKAHEEEAVVTPGQQKGFSPGSPTMLAVIGHHYRWHQPWCLLYSLGYSQTHTPFASPSWELGLRYTPPALFWCSWAVPSLLLREHTFHPWVWAFGLQRQAPRAYAILGDMTFSVGPECIFHLAKCLFQVLTAHSSYEARQVRE